MSAKKWATGGVLAAGLLVAAHRDVLYDATLHTPTEAEVRIEQGLRSAFGIDAGVRCLSPGELNTAPGPLTRMPMSRG